MRSFVLQSFCTLFFCALLLCGCSGDDSESGEQTQTGESSIKTPLADDEVLLQRASEQAIARFTSEMMAALSHAIQVGGPAEALGVCSVVAPDIAVAHARDGWFVSRVTTQPRNAGNEADAIERTILERFSADSTLHFVAQWEDPEAKETFHYYKPIRAQEICMNCHGPENKLTEGVKAKLAEMYPDDQATGYEVGDLRGMFAVEVIWPEGRQYAESLVNPES